MIASSTTYSTNLLTGKKVPIPTAADKDAIDQFLATHVGKPVVAVQGLGFVGAVMSLVCANALHEDYAVLGVDLANEANYWKIASINGGQFPVVASDKKIYEYYESAREKKNLHATYDSHAYAVANVIIVDINLDVAKESSSTNDLIGYDVNLDPFKAAMQTIGAHCKEDVLLLVETTVPPGTCQKVVKPIIDEALTKRGLRTDAWRLGHSYERVMPGPHYVDSIQNFYRVYSGIDEALSLIHI